MKLDNHYKYPCTRIIDIKGFGNFLEREMGEPRRNIRLFAKELGPAITSNAQTDISSRMTLVNSGSSANLVAALALAKKVKDAGLPMTAVASAFTFPTTISALIMAGFKVTIEDVAPMSFSNLSIPIPKVIQNNQASVLALTSFLGFIPDIKDVEPKSKRKYFVLLDSCETLGCEDFAALSESVDYITWSFYHPHHLSSYGGGAVYSKSQDDHILADSIAHWGRACRCHIDESLCTLPSGPAHQFTYENLGINVEMSELNACFGRWQLMQWQEIERRRIENFNLLYKLLKDKHGIRIWKHPEGFHITNSPSLFVFPIMIEDLTVDQVWKKTQPMGIEIRTLMGGPVNSQKAFDQYVGDSNCPNADYMYKHVFFVGIHHTLSQDDIQFVGRFLQSVKK